MLKQKLIITFLVLIVMLLSSCSSQTLIPNGEYINTGNDNLYVLRPEDNQLDFFWDISGDRANYYSSGALIYKCSIVEEADKLFFVGETWYDLFSARELGKSFKYEVIYDESTQSITVFED